jgi:hypothetical protein
MIGLPNAIDRKDLVVESRVLGYDASIAKFRVASDE